MKKKIFILFFFVNFCISVINAAYVKDMPYQITQPNGQIINCFITGDEYHRRVFDENGFTIIQHPETGYYVYAVLQNDDLVATNYIVGQTNPVTVGLIANQDISATKKTQKRQFRQSLIPHDEVITPKAATLRTGTLNNITIYIKFSDGNFTHTKTAIEDYYMNPTRGASLFAYYRDISDGNFNMVSTFYPSTTGTTVLAYTDTHPRSYFQPYNASTNTNGYTTEYGTTATAGMYRLHTLFKAAIIDLKTTIESEFTAAQLDYDADNYVDNISFIIQGSSDGWSDILWPHRFNITYGTPTGNIFLNGKRCSDYFLVLENHLFSVTNGHQSVLCHEMYHVLGAPDLYRYDDETIDPIAQWDIMCQNAVPPQHSTAYIADKYGKFIYDVPEITQCGTYAVYPLWDRTPGHNIAFKIRSSLSTTQWYYIEYRKKTGEVYESSNWITGQGLIIYRVNTTVSDGNADGPPDEVYVFRPGGTNNTTDGNINNAFFSSQSGRTTFNSTSNPKCFTSTNAVDNIDISMISASGGDSMTFYVNFPVPPIADFVADYTEILSGTSVNFTNSSTCGVSYSWNFGDGGTSTAENPSHTYNQTGYFTVVLTATNSYGNNVKTRTNYIHVLPSDALPEAEFTFDVTETCTGYVNFTNTSSNYSNLLWDFGDGNTSTEINPQYRYETNGYFTVTLTATNINGDSVYTSPTQIAVDLPTAPTTTSASVCDAAQLTLTATGTGILKWYDAQEGGNLINTGTSYTNIFASTTTYYVENTISNTILSYNVGRTTRGNNQQSSAPTQQQSPQSGIVFNTLQPVKLVSVQVFASQAANNKIIRLLDANDNILYNTTVNIPYNNTTPVTITFPANWNIPIGTGYKLVVTNSRYLYRTTATTLVQFPYTVTDVISLTGPTPTTNNYYNTFYNWVIQTIPETCQSVRTPVTATIFDSFSVNISGQTSICEGETSTLTASCGVGGTIYYQGTNPNGTSTANMTDNVVVSESGTYYFRAKNAQDCWGQVDSITVTVNPLPAAISISPDNGEFCGSATLTVSGGEGGTIYWQGISENGTSVAIASSEQIVTESGTYYFRAGTSEGCWSEQAETTIIINPLPEISMEENIVVCNFPYILPVPEYFENYSWIDTTAQTINPEINEIGNYFLVVTDENGCSASDIVSVILFTNVLIDISSTSCTNPSANNGTATVNINQITPSNILWSNGETTTTIENLASGIYTVTISNDDGCQIVDSVEVSHLVSIMPNESEIFISVFPNPNAGQFTVELNNNNLEFIKYQIIDVKATVVIEKKIIFKDKISISSNLSAGIYYIKLFSKDKIYTQQFIVE